LEVLLSQERKEECKRLLGMLRDGKIKGVMTDFTVRSIIVLMDKLKKLEELKIFFQVCQRIRGCICMLRL